MGWGKCTELNYILSHILVLVVLYHLVSLTKHKKLLKKLFELIQLCNLLCLPGTLCMRIVCWKCW